MVMTSGPALVAEGLVLIIKEKVTINKNSQAQHGGYRPGSGRKPTGRTRRTFQLTDTEYAKLKGLLDKLRTAKSSEENERRN